MQPLRRPAPVPTTAEFHPSAESGLWATADEGIRVTPARGDPAARPTAAAKLTKLTRSQLMRQELEDSRRKIEELSTELEGAGNLAEKLSASSNIIDHQERGIQMRQMHLDTALSDKEELEASVSALEKRIRTIREQALKRKFQSRFWMMAFLASLVENFFPGTTAFIMKTFLIPATVGLITGDTQIIKIIRAALVIVSLGYFRADKIFRKIPALI